MPKSPSAKEKFRTKVVVMIKDCFQLTVRVRSEEKQSQPTLAGVIEKELIEFRSERGPDGGLGGRTVEPSTGNTLLRSLSDCPPQR
jgi:hypothetical protein